MEDKIEKMGMIDIGVESGIEMKGAGGLALSDNLIGRYFSQEGKNPFEFNIYGNPIEWVSEEVTVTDDQGKVIYTQPDVKKPKTWSSLALKVVASKYFWGNIKKGEREDSVKKIVSRVSKYVRRQASEQGYMSETQADILKDEVASICLNQLAVFNSPVWFNAGIQMYNKTAGGVSPWQWDSEGGKVISSRMDDDRPQCSACFILGMEDSMESIMEVQTAEVMLFKGGSGAGSNRSVLRSSKERLTGGGISSGPLSFMKGYDAYGGVIKSGGENKKGC